MTFALHLSACFPSSEWAVTSTLHHRLQNNFNEFVKREAQKIQSLLCENL